MQSGFALLEVGTVREKNSQNILMKNCLDACIGGIVFFLWGYAFAYGAQVDEFIGTEFFACKEFELYPSASHERAWSF